MDKELDYTEQRLIAAEIACQTADAELREIKVKKINLSRELMELDKKGERLKVEGRSLAAKRKATIGFAFYEALEDAGLCDALKKITDDPARFPARVRRAMRSVYQKTDKTLAKLIVSAIERSLVEDLKK